jgi:uncharacterized protein
MNISMIMLGVEDLPRSVAFYRDVVGLPLQGESQEFAFFSAGPVTVALSLPLGRHAKPLSGASEVIFGVESVHAAQSALAERGCTFRDEPREVTPGSWALNFDDPDGHHLTAFGKK